MNKSKAELIASLPEEQRNEFYASLSDQEASLLEYSWEFFSRPNQVAPEGSWKTWLILAGRGFGKTRAGSEWVRAMACGPTPLARGRLRQIALVGETAKDVRDVMVEGSSGILAVHPEDFRPTYSPANNSLTWPNGVKAITYNATEPDQLRGPQFDGAWLDEMAKWRYATETYDMLQFCLRLGKDPRQIITTTPRPIPLVRRLLDDPTTVVTTGSTYENAANLAPSFIEEMRKRYEGTRLGRQELHADVLLDMPGALWKADMVDRNRVLPSELPSMERVVVAIDPAVAKVDDATDDSSETGIIVAGRGSDGLGYVLDDLSCVEMPEGWARKAISGYDMYQADRVIVEINQGGAMVKPTIKAVRDVPVQEVKASRGKVTRAEPISAMYEQNRIKHVGRLAKLEEQMCLFVPGAIEKADRVDALVWAMTALFPSTIVKSRTAAAFDKDIWSVSARTDEFGFKT